MMLNQLRMMPGSNNDTTPKSWMRLNGKEKKEWLKTHNSLSTSTIMVFIMKSISPLRNM